MGSGYTHTAFLIAAYLLPFPVALAYVYIWSWFTTKKPPGYLLGQAVGFYVIGMAIGPISTMACRALASLNLFQLFR